MKKVISFLLAAAMLFALCACGSSGSTSTPAASSGSSSSSSSSSSGSSTPAASSGSTEKTETPVSDGKVYDIVFADTAAEGNPLWEFWMKPMQEAITEAAGGRITFTNYHNGTLAGFGEILKGCQTGVCDMGNDSVNNYPGVFPYSELMVTPGIYFGADFNEKLDNIFAYSQAYTVPAYEAQGLYLIGETPGVPVYFYTTKPLTSTADLSNRTVATSPNYAAMVTPYGAAATNMIPAEQYEAIKLNTIDSVINGAGPLSAFRLYEVLGYAYEIPFATVLNQCFMSKATYDSLPADLQEVLDNFRFSDKYKEIATNFVTKMMENVTSAVQSGRPDFVFDQLPDDVAADMMKACDDQIAAVTKKVRDAGLDADGALAMLESFKK